MTHDNKDALDALQEIQTIVEMYVRGSEWPNTFAKLRAALQLPAVPEGYVLVPIEPTEEMILEGLSTWSMKKGTLAKAYRAMIAAAPSVSDFNEVEPKGDEV